MIKNNSNLIFVFLLISLCLGIIILLAKVTFKRVHYETQNKMSYKVDIRGRIQGELIEQSPDSKLTSRRNYKNSRLEGQFTRFYKSGEVFQVSTYKYDTLFGNVISFYRNGDTLKIESLETGELECYDKSGRVVEKGRKINGEFFGWQKVNIDSTIRVEKYFMNNKLVLENDEKDDRYTFSNFVHFYEFSLPGKSEVKAVGMEHPMDSLIGRAIINLSTVIEFSITVNPVDEKADKQREELQFLKEVDFMNGPKFELYEKKLDKPNRYMKGKYNNSSYEIQFIWNGNDQNAKKHLELLVANFNLFKKKEVKYKSFGPNLPR